LTNKKELNDSQSYALQFLSSDQSPQSLSPSQIKNNGAQRSLSHWNSSSLHVVDPASHISQTD